MQLSAKLLQAVELIQTGENMFKENTGSSMQLVDFVASTEPSPEEAVDCQLEWEQERRGITNGTICDDGFRWSDEVNFNHLFGR